MNSIRLLGNTKVSISDSLFSSKNVKYIQIFHDNDAAFTHKPETEGTITFISNDVEGKRGLRVRVSWRLYRRWLNLLIL